MNDRTEHSPAPQSDEDQISIVAFANVILRHWRIILILPLSFVLASIVWSLTRERTYLASASFMPNAAESRGAAGAAALAQQFGVNLGSDRPGQSTQFYVDLLKSRTLLREAVESEYAIPLAGGRVWKGSLIDYWDIPSNGAAPGWREATRKLQSAISASAVRETGVVRLSVSSDHPVLSERIVQRLLELLNRVNLEVRQARAQDEARFVTSRLKEVQEELFAAERALQAFLRSNREFRNSPELSFEYERLQRHVTMRQEVYVSLLRSQEQTRIDAVRDVPLFTVLDQPVGTSEPAGRGATGRALFALIVGVIVAIVASFIVDFRRRNRNSSDPDYQEFRTLLRQAWIDLKHPSSWFRGGRERRTESRHV